MARFRFSRPARDDLERILATSAERWGLEGRRRYASILAAAMREVAANPEGLTTQARPELAPGLRSFHLRHARSDDPNAKVRRPVHILYYRAISSELIEFVRVLHERMDFSRHIHEVVEGKD
jgi:toxin ParE1/3/4